MRFVETKYLSWLYSSEIVEQIKSFIGDYSDKIYVNRFYEGESEEYLFFNIENEEKITCLFIDKNNSKVTNIRCKLLSTHNIYKDSLTGEEVNGYTILCENDMIYTGYSKFTVDVVPRFGLCYLSKINKQHNAVGICGTYNAREDKYILGVFMLDNDAFKWDELRNLKKLVENIVNFVTSYYVRGNVLHISPPSYEKALVLVEDDTESSVVCFYEDDGLDKIHGYVRFGPYLLFDTFVKYKMGYQFNNFIYQNWYVIGKEHLYVYGRMFNSDDVVYMFPIRDGVVDTENMNATELHTDDIAKLYYIRQYPKLVDKEMAKLMVKRRK